MNWLSKTKGLPELSNSTSPVSFLEIWNGKGVSVKWKDKSDASEAVEFSGRGKTSCGT